MTTSIACYNRITGKVHMYVCKGPLVRYICMKRTTIEYLRKVPQVEYVKYVRTRPQVDNLTTGSLVKYVCIKEQDHK